jgi:hypothetical protein
LSSDDVEKSDFNVEDSGIQILNNKIQRVREVDGIVVNYEKYVVSEVHGVIDDVNKRVDIGGDAFVQTADESDWLVSATENGIVVLTAEKVKSLLSYYLATASRPEQERPDQSQTEPRLELDTDWELINKFKSMKNTTTGEELVTSQSTLEKIADSDTLDYVVEWLWIEKSFLGKDQSKSDIKEDFLLLSNRLEDKGLKETDYVELKRLFIKLFDLYTTSKSDEAVEHLKDAVARGNINMLTNKSDTEKLPDMSTEEEQEQKQEQKSIKKLPQTQSKNVRNT